MKKINRPERIIDIRDPNNLLEIIQRLVDFANEHQAEHEKEVSRLDDRISECNIKCGNLDIPDQPDPELSSQDLMKETVLGGCEHQWSNAEYCPLCDKVKPKSNQPKETKVDKIAEVIKDYAHDYRDMELEEEHLRVMLQDFHTAILEEEK